MVRLLVMTWLFGVGTGLAATAPAPAAAPQRLEVIRTIPHSGYSEGLDYAEGYLWNTMTDMVLQREGDGVMRQSFPGPELTGTSWILKIDPKDGNVVQRFPGPTGKAESIKWVGGKAYHVTFSDNAIYEGKVAGGAFTFRPVGKVPEAHAWGLEMVNGQFVVTGDYSRSLYFLDRTRFSVKRTLETDMRDLEDLAWDGKRLWASSFTQMRGHIFPVNLTTGKVGPFFSLPDPTACPVIDGLALADPKEGKALWVTGKHCPAIYLVKLPR